MFIERTWEDGKAELFSMDNAGTILRMHEGHASCWFLEVETGGKVNALLKNSSVNIIRDQYNAIKTQWVGSAAVVAVTD